MKRHRLAKLTLNWRLHFLPIMIWLGTVIIVAVLFFHRSQRFEIMGIAQGQVRQIAATCPCRLTNVPVGLFEKVSQEQTLAIVNTVLEDQQSRSELQGQLKTISAEIEHLNAQLIPAQEKLLADKADRIESRSSNARRFAADVETRTLDVLRLKAMIESDKIALRDLALDVNSNDDLLEKNAITPYVLQKTKNQHDALAKKIEENENLLVQANAALEQAETQQKEYLQQQPYNPSIDGELEVIQKAIDVQQQRMNEVELQIEALNQRSALEFKAPFDGVVSQVLRKQGEVVLAGEPILTVTGNNIINIIGYASEDQIREIREGMEVELMKISGSTKIQIERSSITYIGPDVEEMPQRLWQNPNVPQWGRPFLVQAPSQMDLMAGELLGIRKL